MKNATRWLITISCAALLGGGVLAAQAPVVKNRQKAQQQRIREGVRSGELTPRETRKLRKKSARIHRSTKNDRLDGGVFTPKERAKAQRKLNKQSRNIRHEKHDNQQR